MSEHKMWFITGTKAPTTTWLSCQAVRAFLGTIKGLPPLDWEVHQAVAVTEVVIPAREVAHFKGKDLWDLADE